MSLTPIDLLVSDTHNFERGLLVVRTNGGWVLADTLFSMCVVDGLRSTPLLLGMAALPHSSQCASSCTAPGIVYGVVHLHAHSAVVRAREAVLVLELVRA
jgi:hypothetical protein